MKIMRNVGPDTDLEVLVPHIKAFTAENFAIPAIIGVAKFSGRQDLVKQLIDLKRLRDKQGYLLHEQTLERRRLMEEALIQIQKDKGREVRDRLYHCL